MEKWKQRKKRRGERREEEQGYEGLFLRVSSLKRPSRRQEK